MAWMEVRRKVRNRPPGDYPNANPFYIAGLSEGTRKIDIRDCFRRFGEIVDIYMGTKKNSSGKNFAFVKFIKVKDIWSLEKEMQGVVCYSKTLSVNIAKYGRDKNLTGGAPPQPKPSLPKPAAPAFHYAPREMPSGIGPSSVRTFAEVISGSSKKPPALPTPISLQVSNTARNWLSNSVLVGEALSLDHMASLPSYLNVRDGSLVGVKYIGGLNVALCFKNHSLAKEFLDDSDRWIEWFHWIVFGDSKDFCDERIAWVNVMGLPVRLWSDDNISSIIKPFGKIIVPPEELEPHLNSSVIRFGILTRYRRCWSPFSCNSDEKCEDDDFSDDFDEEDDVSSEDFKGLEEGEILEESIEGSNDRAESASAGGDDPGMEISSVVPETVDIPESPVQGDALTDNNNNCMGCLADNTCKQSNDVEEDTGCMDDLGGADACNRVSDPPCEPVRNGPIRLSLPPNCFGPFPSSFPPRPDSPPTHSVDEIATAAGSWVKRRKLNKADHRSSPYRCHSQPNRTPARSNLVDPLHLHLRLTSTANLRILVSSEVTP
ncbi:hypothetical protein L1887_36391 [Cichorium endivia]|nr:hypothetical protein L1887_36391 [Cichorium endivia]